MDGDIVALEFGVEALVLPELNASRRSPSAAEVNEDLVGGCKLAVRYKYMSLLLTVHS